MDSIGPGASDRNAGSGAWVQEHKSGTVMGLMVHRWGVHPMGSQYRLLGGRSDSSTLRDRDRDCSGDKIQSDTQILSLQNAQISRRIS